MIYPDTGSTTYYLRDRDGDLWALFPKCSAWKCVTQDAESLLLHDLEERYGPVCEPVWTVRAAE